MRFGLDLPDMPFIYDQRTMNSHERFGVETFLKLVDPDMHEVARVPDA
jgi:hypothetical protein